MDASSPSTTQLSTSTHQFSAVENKALSLLSIGVPQVQVASACGISESRVSQLLGDENFAAALADSKFAELKKHTARDSAADELESSLLKQLSDAAALCYKPMEIARIYQIVNAAKRRGATTSDHANQRVTIIKLNLPTQIINNFRLNSANQVISAGDQDLITIQSGAMDSLLNRQKTVDKVKDALSGTEFKILENKNTMLQDVTNNLDINKMNSKLPQARNDSSLPTKTAAKVGSPDCDEFGFPR